MSFWAEAFEIHLHEAFGAGAFGGGSEVRSDSPVANTKRS